VRLKRMRLDWGPFWAMLLLMPCRLEVSLFSINWMC
jgi:hypothetical protein